VETQVPEKQDAQEVRNEEELNVVQPSLKVGLCNLCVFSVF